MFSLEIIFSTLLVLSLLGMGYILFKKIPVLVKLPESDFSKLLIISGVKKVVKKIPGSEKFDYELYLQKILSKARVLTIKTENKTGNWLEGLRKRRNGQNHNDEYWKELKKAKDGK